MADALGENPASGLSPLRSDAVGFSIGSKGYIGTAVAVRETFESTIRLPIPGSKKRISAVREGRYRWLQHWRQGLKLKKSFTTKSHGKNYYVTGKTFDIHP